jgi:hypothetical protein
MPFVHRTLLTTTLLATACNPCHDWEAVKIVDGTGLDDGEGVAAIREAIDVFASWTGREETCVGKVRVVEDPTMRGEKIGGQYRTPTHNILVRHRQAEGVMGDTTVHEFCHALDHEEGWPSKGWAEELEPHTEGLNEVLYATDEERTVEAFARICQAGPRLHPMWEQIEEVCGIELYDEGIELVYELAFASSGGQSDAKLGTFSASKERWELTTEDGLDGERWGNQFVTGAEGLFHLELDGTWLDEETYEVVPIIQHIDPVSATVLDWLALEPHGAHWDEHDNPVYTWHDLLGSSSDPLLYDQTAPGGAWRVRVDPLRLEAIDFPTLPEHTQLRGAEHDSALLLLLGGDDLALASLETGEVLPIHLDDETLTDPEPKAIAVTEDGAAALFDGASSLQLVGLDWQGEATWRETVPCTGCTAHELWLQPDGAVLIRPSMHTMSGNGTQPFPLLYDPATEIFRTPDGACSDGIYWLQGVPWQGEQWATQRGWFGDAEEALTLYRIDLESD